MRAHFIAFGLVALVGCNSAPHDVTSISSMPGGALPGNGSVAQDDTPKLASRLVPPETYMRTYLNLFGGLAPLDLQRQFTTTTPGGLFDVWDDYLSAIGLPNYEIDFPRAQQTNTIMLAAFERLGIAMCDRSLQHDIVSGATPLIYPFDMPTGLDIDGFTTRFDVLHRTFLGYPAALAPTDRIGRFFALYQQIVTNHQAHGAPHTFTPEQSGWANVCYGLIRHPEFHLY